jgi:hypothetical protein
MFIDLATGDLRLQSNSPCINAGDNAYAPASLDLDDNPRIVGGTVDIGAYEVQSPASTISYAWLLQHGLSTDGSADYSDGDGDFFSNYHEWRAGTDPAHALSRLRLLSPVPLGFDLAVTWESVPGRRYALERSANFDVTPRSLPLAIGIPAQPGTNATTFVDTNAAGPGAWFYRVRVE